MTGETISTSGGWICANCGAWVSMNDSHACTPRQYQSTSATNSCPRCGAATLFGDRYCRQCGERLVKI